MFTRVLVGFDGSESARHAVDRAAELARAANGEVESLTVGRSPDYAQTVRELHEAREQATRFYGAVVEQVVSDLRRRGVSAHGHIAFGDPGDIIPATATETGADLIVVGAKRHSALGRWLLGTTVNKVLDHARCSVLVVRTGP